MLENPVSFWETYNNSSIRPMDRVINAANQERNPNTPQTISDFVFGCRTIFSMMQQIEPDLVILPLRGAVPIGWVVEEFEQLNGKHYPKVYPRVGDHINALDGRQGGYPLQTKQDIVRVDLSNVTGVVERPLLIDEVQAGSTLTEVASLLSSELRDVFSCETLYVIGAQDTRVMQRKKTKDYLQLVGNLRPQFIASTVNLPLFYIDRNEFLDYLLEPTGKESSKTPTMLHTMHNIEAEDLFKNLTYGVLYPDILLRVIKDIRDGKGGQLIEEGDSDEISARLSKWINVLLAPRDDYYLKAENGAILDWLEKLGNINLQR